MVTTAYLGTVQLGKTQTDEWLKNRAEFAARAISYATETVRDEKDLIRLVNSVGAESDVEQIVVVAGDPLVVIASTHNAWIGNRLAELDDASVQASLQSTMHSNGSTVVFAESQDVVNCVLPLEFTTHQGQKMSGGVLVCIDTKLIQRNTRTWASRFASTFFIVTGITFSITWLLSHRVVILPIQTIIDSIRTNQPVTVPSQDEIGVLAKTLNANRIEQQNIRKNLEKALRDVNAIHSALDRHCILSVADRSGKIIDVNTGFCIISGYSRDELLGKDHRILNSGTHPREFWIQMWRQIASGIAWRGVVCNRRKDGSLYWVDSTIVPYLGEDGTIEKYISLRFDVTAEKEAEIELSKAKLAAEAATQAKSEFLANMSHEIRTPMTAILGYADLLADETVADCPDRIRVDYVDTIKRNGEYLLAILNDILDISKIEAGKMAVESLPIRTLPMVHEVEKLMQVRARAKNIRLSFVQDSALPQTFNSDPVRLRQILMNLVGNAIKFTEVGSVTIHVGCKKEAEIPLLYFAVRDTGPGMTRDQMKNLFEAFHQADTSVTRKFGGTGLGLKISKSLATMLGGTIEVESQPMQGSTFTLHLPFAPSESTQWLEPPSPSKTPAEDHLSASPAQPSKVMRTQLPQKPLQGIRIYFAEDGPDNQKLIQFHLKRAGAEVTLFDNGLLCLQSLCQDGDPTHPMVTPAPCDLILTDMQMPEMDGYTLANQLRSKGWKGPIIALTAHAMEGEDLPCLDAGCDAYATKPIDRDHLIEVCRSTVENKLVAESVH